MTFYYRWLLNRGDHMGSLTVLVSFTNLKDYHDTDRDAGFLQVGMAHFASVPLGLYKLLRI